MADVPGTGDWCGADMELIRQPSAYKTRGRARGQNGDMARKQQQILS